LSLRIALEERNTPSFKFQRRSAGEKMPKIKYSKYLLQGLIMLYEAGMPQGLSKLHPDPIR
jgi:hypothetical protein